MRFKRGIERDEADEPSPCRRELELAVAVLISDVEVRSAFSILLRGSRHNLRADSPPEEAIQARETGAIEACDHVAHDVTLIAAAQGPVHEWLGAGTPPHA